MTITEPAEHEVGGLGAESEHRLAWYDNGPQLREGEPDDGRSCISQPSGGDGDPLGRDAERRRQNGIHTAIGLMAQDIVGWPTYCSLRRIILARHDDRAGPRLSHVYYGQMGRGRAPALTVADGGSDTPSCSVGFPEFRHDFAAIQRSGLSDAAS